MAAVELLAAGIQADEGAGAGVDVTAHARLVQVIDVSASDAGHEPELAVTFETGPSAAGPWTEIRREVLNADPMARSWGPRRVLIGEFDDFVRVRWAGRRYRGGGGPPFSFGVAGTGV
ncbi:MAG TPA: hypothetical protein PKD61_16330 [Polyangiaceae bacterium]|nr:hypothetical protein [Polyangiaceae bacterium]